MGSIPEWHDRQKRRAREKRIEVYRACRDGRRGMAGVYSRAAEEGGRGSRQAWKAAERRKEHGCLWQVCVVGGGCS